MPRLLGHFNQWMVSQRKGMPTWLDVYPYQSASKQLTPDQAFFIDVAGGVGHQAIALRKALPSLPNRIIVQDIPAVLEQADEAKKLGGVELMAQDFYKPQQVKGAKFYYMRNIMHDYPDSKAIEILSNTRAALGPDSKILIDDMYLDSENVHWQATQIDLTMMMALSAIERTSQQWQELIPKAGLKVSHVYQYTESLKDSIIECVAA